jgi:protein TonB
MKKIIPFLFFAFVMINAIAQKDTNAINTVIPPPPTTGINPQDGSPFTIVDQMPEYVGGQAAMVKFISENIQYPKEEKDAGITGTCYVTFVVERDGSISNTKIIRGIAGGPGCDKEAARVVSIMPNWIPGRQNGREVRVQFNLPIKYKLPGNTKNKEKKLGN